MRDGTGSSRHNCHCLGQIGRFDYGKTSHRQGRPHERAFRRFNHEKNRDCALARGAREAPSIRHPFATSRRARGPHRERPRRYGRNPLDLHIQSSRMSARVASLQTFGVTRGLPACNDFHRKCDGRQHGSSRGTCWAAALAPRPRMTLGIDGRVWSAGASCQASIARPCGWDLRRIIRRRALECSPQHYGLRRSDRT